MKLSAPITLRQTFQMFHLYRPDIGVSSVVDLIDWCGVTPAQIYAAVLGRLPENRKVAMPGLDYDPREHFIETLCSVEFQERFIENFLDAFHEKNRVLFVHIPKCAGMDIEFDLGERFVSLSQSITLPHMTGRPDLFKVMAMLSSDVLFSDTIFVNGHIPLSWYLDHGVYRFCDRIFATVREPVSLIVSWVNYIMTVLLSDRDISRLDTAEWLAALGEATLPEDISEQDCVDLARRVLHNPLLVQPNYLCCYFGNGTFDSTLDPIALSNIEILDISRYTAWRYQAWGLSAGSRRNQSSPILTKETLSPDDQEHLMALTCEDRPLYAAISQLIGETNEPSIRGLELVRRMTRS